MAVGLAAIFITGGIVMVLRPRWLDNFNVYTNVPRNSSFLARAMSRNPTQYADYRTYIRSMGILFIAFGVICAWLAWGASQAR